MEKVIIPALSSKFKLESIRYIYRFAVGGIFDALITSNFFTIPRNIYNIQGLTPVKGVNIKKGSMLNMATEFHIPKDLVEDENNKKLILFNHGGGFVIGSTISHRAIASTLCNKSNIPVLTYNYRLAPEHLFPAPVEDAFKIYQHLINERNYKAENITIIGDSAGGSLSLEIIDQCRQHNTPEPKALCIFSPLVDYSPQAYLLNSKKHVILSPKLVAEFSKTSCSYKSIDFENIIDRDFQNYPPILIQTGKNDVLFEQSLALNEKLTTANNSGILEIWEDMWHVWHGMIGIIKEADLAIDHISDFLKQQYAK